jgi:hypothetical protein|tara:strand:- start:266 stop:457 length:192 start_codon:yes stop_codon:yes gene_type:complete
MLTSKLIKHASTAIKIANPDWQLKQILSTLKLSNQSYDQWHPAALGVMEANKLLGTKGGFRRF